MVQAEVADRLVAGPGSKTYGSPSVKTAWYGAAQPGRFDQPVGVLAGTRGGFRAGRVRASRAPAHRRPGGGVRGDRRGVRPAAQDAAVGAGRLGRIGRLRRDGADQGGGRSRRPAARCSASTSSPGSRLPSRRSTRSSTNDMAQSASSPRPARPSSGSGRPAKINLHLAVGDVRPDGYHDLVTVFHAVDLADELTDHAGGPRIRSAPLPADGVPGRREEPGRRCRPAAGQAQPGPADRWPSRSPSRSRWPAAWPAAAPTRRPRWSGAPRCGGWTSGRAELAADRRRDRRRRAVRADRRHRRRDRPG